MGRDQIDEYLERWLAEAVQHSVRPKTYMNYALCVRRLRRYLGRVRLRALTPDHIQHAIGKLLDDGLSPRTVRQVHIASLRANTQDLTLLRRRGFSLPASSDSEI